MMDSPDDVRWPDARAEWILYEDEDVVAVAKPAGVPSQAADPSWPDDLPWRLRRFLGSRDSQPSPYLGIHHRLDRETSGVLLYAKRKEVNASLAEQFEGRRVDKTYLAAVTGWVGGERRLTAHLAPDGQGGSALVDARDRRGKEAVMHVRVLRRMDGRALLEVKIETGRMHQIRAQLADAGAPIAGDARYGGAPAERMLLHATRIALRHPGSGETLSIEAPAPAIFDAWCRGATSPFERAGGFEEALARAVERRFGLGRAHAAPQPTTAFRLVSDADGIEGLAVDVYGEHLVAHFSGGAASAREPEVLDALHELGFASIYVKRRPKQANDLVDTRRDEVAPAAPLRGPPAPDPLVVYEGGVPYRVRLGDGLSTGLFLDQRINRGRVRELAPGARVLNLFAYTGPFTVAAAAGGARSTLTVDVAAPALAWAEANIEDAGLRGDHHRFMRGDVFEVLAALAKKGERFDLIIADPPTYSTTKRGRWRSGKDWVALATAIFAVTAKGGRVLACSNDRRMTQARFRKHLHSAGRLAEREPGQMKDVPMPRDFAREQGPGAYLKSVLLRFDMPALEGAPKKMAKQKKRR